MNFFHVTKKLNSRGKTPKSHEYFKVAAEANQFVYVPVVIEDIDPLLQDLPKPSSEDCVYRDVGGQQARAIEKILIAPVNKTSYCSKQTVFTGRGDSYDLMKQAGVPVIPSVTVLPRKKKDQLAVAEHLGGFPVVIKVYGGMEGVGVLRADSQQSFTSIIDFVRKNQSSTVRIMKYIPHQAYARLVVVGDGVVAGTRDVAPMGDFRANTRGPREVKTELYAPTPEVALIAVAAVKSVGMKVGGVDVLFGDDGNAYVSEVNNPFNVAETQEHTGIDIASKILEELSQ